MLGEFQIAFQQQQRYICDINAPTGLNLNLPQSYHKCVASFSWHDSNSYFSTIMPEYVVIQIHISEMQTEPEYVSVSWFLFIFLNANYSKVSATLMAVDLYFPNVSLGIDPANE